MAAGTTGVLGGSRAVSSLVVKLVWLPGPASIFIVGSQHHSSLGGDSTFNDSLLPQWTPGRERERDRPIDCRGDSGSHPHPHPQGNMTLLAS